MQAFDTYLSESLLHGLFDQPGWKIGSQLPYWITFQVPSYKDAVYIAKYLAAPIVANGDNGLNVFIQYSYNRKQIICQINQDGEFMSQAQLNIPGVTIGGPIDVNRELLDVFGEMLSAPERSIGLVRLADERQISVSGGANGKYLVGASVDQATSWKRADYWHPEDLDEFNRAWQQAMEPNSNRWFRVSLSVI